MTSKTTAFAVLPPAVGAGQVTGFKTEIDSPAAPQQLQFTVDEQELYDYICDSLRKAGIEHMTAGIPIAVIVRTFADWLKAVAKCEKEGRTQTSKTGWVTEMPWAKDEVRLKMELGQWLPKACLTIPSLARVRKDTGAQGGQDDLFGALVAHGTASPGNRPTH
ncbi:hypothetical protein [Comamonas sp. GB3 AK4-5]|uniref:hypothetical protein n=1 Tax=Comamonas sp. GB3 AK4-5 TaxID=3231487 RepID=UPI00351F13DD